MHIQRNISGFALFLAAIGGIVGSGWLFGPLYAARIAGGDAWLSWLIGGVMMMILSLSFAEVTSSVPRSGSSVHLAHMTHDSVVGFTFSWLLWIACVVVAPIETIALLQYSSNYLPFLIENVSGTEVLTTIGVIFAATILLLMCVLNYFSARFFSKSNNAIVLFKLAVPTLTLITLAITAKHFTNLVTHDSAHPFSLENVFSALPNGGILFSFLGFTAALQMAGEIKNPSRTIPVALIGAIIFCLLLYVGLQIVFIGNIDPQLLINGWANLKFMHVNGPFAGVAEAMGLIWLVGLIYVDALISPFGTAYIYTAGTARANFAMAKYGYFPAKMRSLNKFGIPFFAIIANYIVGLMMLLPLPSWQNMVSVLVSCIVLAQINAPLAVIILRDKYPEKIKSFRLPMAPVLAFLAFYICSLIIQWTGWQTIKYDLILLGIGYIYLFIYKLFNPGKLRVHWQHSLWLIIYLIGIGIMSYAGVYGNGHGYLPFGWDLLVILIFNLFIFALAVYCARPRKTLVPLAVR